MLAIPLGWDVAEREIVGVLLGAGVDELLARFPQLLGLWQLKARSSRLCRPPHLIEIGFGDICQRLDHIDRQIISSRGRERAASRGYAVRTRGKTSTEFCAKPRKGHHPIILSVALLLAGAAWWLWQGLNLCSMQLATSE